MSVDQIKCEWIRADEIAPKSTNGRAQKKKQDTKTNQNLYTNKTQKSDPKTRTQKTGSTALAEVTRVANGGSRVAPRAAHPYAPLLSARPYTGYCIENWVLKSSVEPVSSAAVDLWRIFHQFARFAWHALLHVQLEVMVIVGSHLLILLV